LLMKCWIHFLEEIVKGQTSTTIMALEVGIILYRIDVPACLIFIACGITTNRASEVVEIRLNPLKFLQA